MPRLLGIDVGTSAVKALVIDELGRVLGEASEEVPLSTPQPGWAEQDPEDWWRAVQACLSQLSGGFDSIGLTGQMHGSVLLDADGAVVRPALLWCDQRTAAECEEIDALAGADKVRRITANPPLTGFQAPKLLWVRKHEPEAWSRVRQVLLPKDFVRLRLTGESATDVSDASGTGLLDVAERNWATGLMSTLRLDSGLFPPVLESAVVSGRTAEGVPVAAGAGDQAAAAVGVGAVEPGIVSLSLGTSGVAFSATPGPVPDPSGSVHVFCHANGGWHAMGVVLSCGGAVRWARDVLCPDGGYDELASLAGQATPGCDGVTFLPYLAGERCPFVDPTAQASWQGLSLANGRPEMARSVFEAASFALVEAVDALLALGAGAERIRVTGGGAASPLWRGILADCLNRETYRLESDQGPAFGAAMLGGVAVGVWPDVQQAVSACVRETEATRPSGTDYMPALERYRSLRPTQRGPKA